MFSSRELSEKTLTKAREIQSIDDRIRIRGMNRVSVCVKNSTLHKNISLEFLQFPKIPNSPSPFHPNIITTHNFVHVIRCGIIIKIIKINLNNKNSGVINLF